jgi:pimeloyl-ACP methyl ester carboxylesterase
MRHTRLWVFVAMAALAIPAGVGFATSVPKWRSLPRPSALPTPTLQGTVAVDDVVLWYASFGAGAPVLLLHGGLGNSNHFGDLITALATTRQVIVMDSRGHGRSTRSRHGISYTQMADDVVALLDHLAIDRIAIVGWSDGGITGLDVAIRYPQRLTKLFLLGSNSDRSGVRPARKSAIFAAYLARCKREYAALAPDPKQLPALLKELRVLWSSQPSYTTDQLANLRVPTVIAVGQYDEIIRRDHAEKMARSIPRATLRILPQVSHFAVWQDRQLVAAQIKEFLDSP